MRLLTFKETRLRPESSLGKSLSSMMSTSPSISDPSLELVLPSEPVDVMDADDSFPETLGLASVAEFLQENR